MNTEELIPPLRDLPPGRLEARKQHLLVEITSGGESRRMWFPWRTDDAASVRRSRGGPISRPRLILVGLACLAVCAAVATAAVSTLGGAGAARQRYTAVAASNVNDVIAQVESSFADGLIQSASTSGSTVTVNLATTGLDSPTVGGFEAGVLAHAIADWQGAHGLTPAAQLNVVQVDANGEPGPAQAESVTGDSSATPLPSGACQGAAQNLPTSIVVVSAQTLPYAGGTCIFKVQTSADPNATAVAVHTAMSNAITNAGDYPSLIEVDDPSGNPQIVLTSVPGINGVDEGRLFVRPGLSSTLHG